MKKHLLAAWVVTILVAGAVSFGLFHVFKKDAYRIHFVNYRGHTMVDAGFEQYLGSRNIKYEIIYHDLDRNPARFPGIIKAIKDDDSTDLVVTWGTTVTLGVFGRYDQLTPDKISSPGVFTLVSDPVSSKIVQSLPLSGRNITGSWHVAPIRAQFGSMMVYKPAKSIGVLYTPTENNSHVIIAELRKIADLGGVEIIAVPFEIVDGKPVSTNATAVIETMKKAGVGWLYMPPDSFLGTQARDLVIPAAHRAGIPTFASTEQLMQAGAAFGLLSPYEKIGELAARKAEQILVKGKTPAEVPVDTVERFNHQMNPEAVARLGIKLSESMLKTIEAVSPQ